MYHVVGWCKPCLLEQPPLPPGCCLALLQPRCAEPWTEVIFESEATGRLQVIVSPLVRLTNRAEAAIQDIGPPEGLLTSLGPFITGQQELERQGWGVGGCSRG
jgi:hypothetical protein